MTTKSTYQVAKKVSTVLEDHFIQNLRSAEERGETGYALPPPDWAIEKMIDAAFWTSLRREEGHAPKISLAYVAPDNAEHAFVFNERMPLNSYYLTKLSPGVERSGIHIGVWQEEGELFIWGSTTRIPNLCFVLDVSEPGLLVVKHRRTEGFGKYVNVAVMTGDQVKVLDDQGSSLAKGPEIIQSLLNFTSADNPDSTINVFVQLAVSMRAHGRGGTLLVVPDNSGAWRSSIQHPLQFTVHPSKEGLPRLLRNTKRKTSIQQEINRLAGLTAIDGATIITCSYSLLAFGAKIRQHDGKAVIEKVISTEPVKGVIPTVEASTRIGGTRHLSAAQFVQDQPDSFAMVASQDGRFTLFFWSKESEMVQAHRIETLLL